MPGGGLRKRFRLGWSLRAFAAPVFCMLTLAGVLGGLSRAPSAELLSAKAAAPSPQPSGARLKQELQIKLLQQETGLQGSLEPYIPLLSVVVAVLGVGFGAYKYVRDRRRDFALRVEQEVAVNLGYLVEYPSADSRLNARVATALDNLNWLISKTEDPARYSQRVTEAILVEVRDDIDFDDEKQARFDALCLARWPSYGSYIGAHADLQDFILYRYRQALRVLRDKDPAYFATIRRAGDGSYRVDRFTKENLYRHFQVLVYGFAQQVELIADPERREREIKGFADALGNPGLASQVFAGGGSVEYRS